MNYEFTLKFKLPENESDTDAVIEKLGEAGCTDALVGVGLPGRIALDFTRKAKSAKEAIRSAIRDVRSAIPNARLIEAGPDFVGVTDVAQYAGVTRQNIRKLIVRWRDFPPAVHEGSASVWHLADVLQWFTVRGDRSFEPRLLEIATLAMHLNVTAQAKQLSQAQRKEIEALV